MNGRPGCHFPLTRPTGDGINDDSCPCTARSPEIDSAGTFRAELDAHRMSVDTAVATPLAAERTYHPLRQRAITD